jgi:hypothetical protein
MVNRIRAEEERTARERQQLVDFTPPHPSIGLSSTGGPNVPISTAPVSVSISTGSSTTNTNLSNDSNDEFSNNDMDDDDISVNED